jgi:hypothetical protein
MTKRKLRYASLASAVFALSAGAADSSATTVYTESNLSGTGGSAQFVALVDADLHRPPILQYALGNLPSGQAQQSFDVPDSDSFTSYAVFGLDNSGGVFVSFSTPGYGVGESFENLFPGISESDLVADLPTDGPAAQKLAALLATMPVACTPVATQCSCTHLSVGADYGTFDASFTPLPEPGTCTLIFVATGYSLLPRKRRT